MRARKRAELNARRACTDPVSYTHLDVYKRQAYGLGKTSIELGKNVSETFAPIFRKFLKGKEVPYE